MKKPESGKGVAEKKLRRGKDKKNFPMHWGTQRIAKIILSNLSHESNWG